MKTSVDDFELPDEVNFARMKRVPNPFRQKFHDLNLVSLDEDVKAVFPDSTSVNEALLQLISHSALVAEKSLKKAS